GARLRRMKLTGQLGGYRLRDALLRARPCSLRAEALEERDRSHSPRRARGDVAGDDQDRQAARPRALDDSADHLAGERRRVDEALAGDDVVGGVELAVEPDALGDKLEAGREDGSEGGEAAGQPARRAGP